MHHGADHEAIAAPCPSSPSPTASAASPSFPAATAEQQQQQQQQQQPTPHQHQDVSGGGEDNDAAGAAEQPSADFLKSRMDRCKRLVAWLEEEGFEEGDPALVHAIGQAAAAEQEWRDAAPGVAVSKRLLSAEQALRRAKRVQAKQEQAISDYDQWYETERLAMVTHLGELRARTRNYELRLAQVSREAAQAFRAPGEEGGTRAEGDEIREAVDTIEDEVAPALREVLGMAPEGSALRAKITEVMGAVSAVYSLASHATRARHPAQFDIASGADDDSWQWHHGDGGDGYGGHGGGYGHNGHDAWDDRYADQGWIGTAGYGSPERFDWADASEEATPMDTAEVDAPRWMRDDDGDGSAWGSQAWKRGRWTSERRHGDQGALFGDVGTAPHDGQAVPPQAGLGNAAAAATPAVNGADPATSAAPPTPQCQSPAQTALERRKQEVWDAAQDEGVEVACEEIARMDAQQLERWAAENIQGI